MRYRSARDLPLIEVVRDSRVAALPAGQARLRPGRVGSLLLLLTTPVLLPVRPPGCASRRRGRSSSASERVGPRAWCRSRSTSCAPCGSTRRRRDPNPLVTAERPPPDPDRRRLGACGWTSCPSSINVPEAAPSTLVGPRPERPGFVARFTQRRSQATPSASRLFWLRSGCVFAYSEELPATHKKNKRVLVSIGSLIGALDGKMRVVKKSLFKTFTDFASPLNEQLFRELFVSK